MRKLILSVLFVMLFLLCPHLGYAFDVTVAWDPSASGDIKEYVVYYDTISGASKGNSVTAGEALEFTVSGLTSGVLYYFHITAKDWEGRESGPSNEVRTDGVVTPDSGQDPMAPGGCYIKSVTP